MITSSCITVSATRGRPTRSHGFTLLEVMITLAALGILATIALGQFGRYMDRVKVARATIDIGGIEGLIGQYQGYNHALPDALSDLNPPLPLDPWGNAYQYLNHETAHGRGGFRKDKRIVPINGDYDLYSMGKDGRSVAPLTASVSRDDIVRANDGHFVGLVSDYDP